MKVINIVSGKGGTGKTLLTAVLAETLGNEDCKVLVVDLDVFVRGLTSLLYYHKKEKVQLCADDELTIAEFFMTKGDTLTSGKTKLAISRYRSFDVTPSVSRVDELLLFSDLMPDDKIEAKEIISNLISLIPDDYDYVFFDSRAGYDELIAASHFYSDITICVEEEDNISKITTDNLIKQMQEDCDSPIFRLINKSSASGDEFSQNSVSHIGKIPFDMDVMRSFGKEGFWNEISKTLYKNSLSIAWNNLANKMDLLPRIKLTRVSPVGSGYIEKQLQFFSLKDRVIILYGIALGFLGVLYPLYNIGMIKELFSNKGFILNIASSIMGLLSFAITFSIILKNRKK